MPVIKKLKDSMVKLKVSADMMAQMDFDADGNAPHAVISLIDKMDALLTREQCLLVMEQQGCCKGGKRDKDCKAFGKEHKGKPLAQKLALMSTIENMMSPVLNEDGTFTITWGNGYQNGAHAGKTTCSCGAIKKLKQPFYVSVVPKKLCKPLKSGRIK